MIKWRGNGEKGWLNNQKFAEKMVYYCFIFFFGGSVPLSWLVISRLCPGAMDLPPAPDAADPRSPLASANKPLSVRISADDEKLPVVLALSRARIWASKWLFCFFRSSRSLWLMEFFRRIYCWKYQNLDWLEMLF